MKRVEIVLDGGRIRGERVRDSIGRMDNRY